MYRCSSLHQQTFTNPSQIEKAPIGPALLHMQSVFSYTAPHEGLVKNVNVVGEKKKEKRVVPVLRWIQLMPMND